MWRQSLRLPTARGETSADGARCVPGHVSRAFGFAAPTSAGRAIAPALATDVGISAGPTGAAKPRLQLAFNPVHGEISIPSAARKKPSTYQPAPNAGKTHLSLAPGVEAVKAGRSVYFYFSSLADIVASLTKAERDGAPCADAAECRDQDPGGFSCARRRHARHAGNLCRGLRRRHSFHWRHGGFGPQGCQRRRSSEAPARACSANSGTRAWRARHSAP